MLLKMQTIMKYKQLLLINGLILVCYFKGTELLSPATFGEGAGRIWLSNLQCRGNERMLLECTANSSGINPCTHAQDIGVRCQSGKKYSLYCIGLHILCCSFLLCF